MALCLCPRTRRTILDLALLQHQSWVYFHIPTTVLPSTTASSVTRCWDRQVWSDFICFHGWNTNYYLSEADLVIGGHKSSILLNPSFSLVLKEMKDLLHPKQTLSSVVFGLLFYFQEYGAFNDSLSFRIEEQSRRTGSLSASRVRHPTPTPDLTGNSPAGSNLIFWYQHS